MTANEIVRPVLVVEDDLDSRQFLVTLLSQHRYAVLACPNGIEALRLLRTLKGDQLPWVVVTDLEMPEMDGWGLFAELQSDARLRSIPVMVVTGRPTGSPRGVLATFYKPIDFDRFLSRLARVGAGTPAAVFQPGVER